MGFAFLHLERVDGTREKCSKAIRLEVVGREKIKPGSPSALAQHQGALARCPAGAPKRGGWRGWNVRVTSLKGRQAGVGPQCPHSTRRGPGFSEKRETRGS